MVSHATFTGDTHNKSPCVLLYPYTGMSQELLLIPVLQVKFLTFRDFCDLFKTAQLVTWRPVTQNLASPPDDTGIMSMGRGCCVTSHSAGGGGRGESLSSCSSLPPPPRLEEYLASFRCFIIYSLSCPSLRQDTGISGLFKSCPF